MAKDPPPAGNLPTTSAPAQRALAGAGFTKLEQLTKISEAELLQLHGMGPKAVGILRAALQSKGLSFAAQSPPKKKG